MPDYVKVSKTDDWIGVWFYNEDDKPFAIGEKMCEINEYAYMNGYNWDALFHYYLAEHAPDILEGLESDPEAGSYAAYYGTVSERPGGLRKSLSHSLKTRMNCTALSAKTATTLSGTDRTS